MSDKFPVQKHKVDICVVGGGMPGLCAALAAARMGTKVVLMQDRPVLGGNASSECRMHICGADRHGALPHLRETGILEELRLENLHCNPQRSFSVWDMVLYDKVRYQPGIELLLNCSCVDLQMSGMRIAGVTGWQTTTETRHEVEADIFIDCSGDSILAPLSGAEYRIGREARSEYGEISAPETADDKTMGMTCLFDVRDMGTPQKFSPPSWALKLSDADLPGHNYLGQGFWWIELGGEQDSIHDTERLRDELLKIVMGVWDHIKNGGDHGADNWALDWIQFLPGKRESRRCIGDHVLTQNDILQEVLFDDIAAYGGWPLDDHHPAGFNTNRLNLPKFSNDVPSPSPYGIPYRCLYSRNVPNLMFAGRNLSATHQAMSSTRVMGTLAAVGQAAGTAAAMAVVRGIDPRGMNDRIQDLQQQLLLDDCYLPGITQEMPVMIAEARLAASCGDPEPLRDGISRQVGRETHCWECRAGDWAAYTFKETAPVKEVRLVLDSAMDRQLVQSHHLWDNSLREIPGQMVRDISIEGLIGGEWTEVAEVKDNYQRQLVVPIGRTFAGIKVNIKQTWKEGCAGRVYAFYIR